jgi:hypothetical protein
MLSPTSDENDPFHDPESSAVGGGVSDSAAVWNVFTLALDSDRVNEPDRLWYEEGGAEVSFPNSDTVFAVGDAVRWCEEDAKEGVLETFGGVAGPDIELSFLDIEESSGSAGDALATD